MKRALLHKIGWYVVAVAPTLGLPASWHAIDHWDSDWRVAAAICLEALVLGLLLAHPWCERVTAARMGLRLLPGASKRQAVVFMTRSLPLFLMLGVHRIWLFVAHVEFFGAHDWGKGYAAWHMEDIVGACQGVGVYDCIRQNPSGIPVSMYCSTADWLIGMFTLWVALDLSVFVGSWLRGGDQLRGLVERLSRTSFDAALGAIAGSRLPMPPSRPAKL